jgi:hypothetical protein
MKRYKYVEICKLIEHSKKRNNLSVCMQDMHGRAQEMVRN